LEKQAQRKKGDEAETEDLSLLVPDSIVIRVLTEEKTMLDKKTAVWALFVLIAVLTPIITSKCAAPSNQPSFGTLSADGTAPPAPPIPYPRT
jgi:hypothetical protein